MSNQECSKCDALLRLTLKSVIASFEDEDKNRYFPVECPHGHAECRPLIVYDGCDGTRRYEFHLGN